MTVSYMLHGTDTDSGTTMGDLLHNHIQALVNDDCETMTTMQAQVPCTQ